MEHEGEDIDGCGSLPEYGAIFMSNIVTKRECLRRKILALPSSKANFVKQVKRGMILFLFEFEKRQLFGVYQAASDGGMNISSSPFVFSGRAYPAQVCITPIWKCAPLFENEFGDAIRENYFTSKKFRFGLSLKQVHRLLHLFSSRKLPTRQFSRIDTRQAVSDRSWSDQDRFPIRQRLIMESCEHEFSPMGMGEFLQNSPHRVTEVDDGLIYVDGRRVENGKGVKFIRGKSLTDQVDDSLPKRERGYDYESDTGLYDARMPLPSYRVDNREVSLDKERRLGIGRFSNAESPDHDRNIHASLPFGVGIKYSKASINSSRRADYEWPDYESTDRSPTDNDRFPGIDTMKTKLNLQRSRRRVISDELEEDLLKRPGKGIDDPGFPMSRLGHHYDMDSGVKSSAVPSKNYDNFQDRTSGGSKVLMDKRMGTEHNLDNGRIFDQPSDKLRNSFSDQIIIDKRRFHGIPSSTTSYEPPEYDPRIRRQLTGDYAFSKNIGLDNRQDGGDFFRPVSKAVFSDSLDTQFFQQKALPSLNTSNSTCHDSVVTRTISGAHEYTNIQRHYSSTGVDFCASRIALGTPHYVCGGDLHGFSNRKPCEEEGYGRFDPAAGIENKDFRPASHNFTLPYPAHVSSAPAVEMSAIIARSTHGSVPVKEAGNLYSWRESPLVTETDTLPQGMQNIQWQEIDPRNDGNEGVSSSPNLALGYPWKQQLLNEQHEQHIHPKAHLSTDDGQHLNPRGVYSGSETQRESVFDRLRPGSRVHLPEESETDDTLYPDPSVDDVMDRLNSLPNIRSKNPRKFKALVGRHDLDEMVGFEKHAAPEHAKRVLAKQMEDGTSRVVAEGICEMPTETRGVEFKRRRDLKNRLDENGTKDNAPRKEDNVTGETVKSEGPVNKQQKRRKLVRPVFESDASVGLTGNENLHPQFHIQNKMM